MKSRLGQTRLAALILALSATVTIGRVQAGPLQSVIDHLTGQASASQAGAAAQARCYGRYLVWRDALVDAIRATDAWPTAAPDTEFNKMQASFVAVLIADRGLTARVSPDLDETGLPADVRAAVDRGVQEAKARLATASAGGAPLQILELQTGPDAMARAQAAIDAAFAPLKTPCARLLAARPPHRAQPPVTLARDDLTPAPASPIAPGAGDDTSNVLASWDGPRWIQVGVSDHANTTGLSERTETIASRGRARQIALVGPFASLPDVRAFCDRLAARGGACVVQLPGGLRAALARRRLHHDTAPVRAADPHSPATRPPQLTLASNQKSPVLAAGLRGRLLQ
jgi:hypothetical protein